MTAAFASPFHISSVIHTLKDDAYYSFGKVMKLAEPFLSKAPVERQWQRLKLFQDILTIQDGLIPACDAFGMHRSGETNEVLFWGWRWKKVFSEVQGGHHD